MYATAKPGQVIYFGRTYGEPRREVTLVRYYKHNPHLLHNNCAIVRENGLNIDVEIKDLYRKPE